jgi:hypothetical protein
MAQNFRLLPEQIIGYLTSVFKFFLWNFNLTIIRAKTLKDWKIQCDLARLLFSGRWLNFVEERNYLESTSEKWITGKYGLNGKIVLNLI